MSIDEQTAARIDDYLNNKLSEVDREKFESELKSNTELADELRIQENLLQIIGERGITTSYSSFSRESIDEVVEFFSRDDINKIRKNIEEVNDQYNGKNTISRSLIYRFTGIAASILILLSFGLSFYLNSDENVYDEYKDKYQPISMIERSESGSKLEAVVNSFNQNEFNEVIELTDNNTSIKFRHPTILLYQGIAYREIGDYEKSLNSFSEFGILSDLDIDLMHWHQGLVYLKLENTDKAKSTFSKIDLNGNFKGISDVKEILDSLK